MPALKVATLTVTPFQQNCTILWDAVSHRGAVVDPGGECERILAAIDQFGVQVESILLTHGHLDHAGGAMELQASLAARGTHAPVVGPDRRDAFLLDGIASQAAAYGIPGMANATPDRWLAEGDEVSIAGQIFDVRHCPGHSPGHVVFLNRADRFAILGDVLFQGSIGRTDFPYGDHDALLDAIESKILPLGDEWAFLCGHGPGSTIGMERRSNPFLRKSAPGTR